MDQGLCTSPNRKNLMNPIFQRLMDNATRLTRAGDRRAAPAAIQAALRGGVPAATASTDMRDVIDVEAREVPDLARAFDDVVPPAPARNLPDTGRFIAGSHGDASGHRDFKL